MTVIIEEKIRERESKAIINSLKAGVTPNIGIQHIQVGRANEIGAMILDIDAIAKENRSAFRVVIGEYGAGKSFFLSVVKSIALKRNLVVANADLSPDRRIHASGGQARNLYSELMNNISTRNKQEGNALISIVEKFITTAQEIAQRENVEVSDVIKKRLSAINDMVGGCNFSDVIDKYWQGHVQCDDHLKSNALKWLRAEYTTKTDAYKDLGVRTIISDASFYDYLKIMSLFVCQAGYAGLLINLDEMVNLFKLSSTQARSSNYEQILRILNDCLQGSVKNLGFILGGTPDFLYDHKKGLYSYEALKSRLATNSIAQRAGLVDYTDTVLNLPSLTPEELYVLLKNLRHVFASGNESDYLVPDEALKAFLQHCNQVIGSEYFKTPRNIIKGFINLLSILKQNPGTSWSELLGDIEIEKEQPTDMAEITDSDGESEDELADFAL